MRISGRRTNLPAAERRGVALDRLEERLIEERS